MKKNQIITELFNELYAQKYIPGKQEDIDDLAIDIDLYIADIMGFTSKYLHGKIPPKNQIKVEPELSIRLDIVINRISLLKATLEKTNELAELLQEEINNSGMDD